jgi:hypothetical protein
MNFGLGDVAGNGNYWTTIEITLEFPQKMKTATEVG